MRRVVLPVLIAVILGAAVTSAGCSPRAQAVKADWKPPIALKDLTTLRAVAATPYSFRGRPQPHYGQIAQAALGLRATVPDLARFVAATVVSPDGAPAGRGIVKPETLALATAGEQGTGGSFGLGYGLTTLWDGTELLALSGNSIGFQVAFVLDPATGNGYAVAANSERSYPTMVWIQDAFTRSQYDVSLIGGLPTLPTLNDATVSVSIMLAGVLMLGLAIKGLLLWRSIRSGRRAWQGRPDRRSGLSVAIAVFVTVFRIGWFYGPLPQPLPVSAIEIVVPPELVWPTAALVLWSLLSIVLSFCPAQVRTVH